MESNYAQAEELTWTHPPVDAHPTWSLCVVPRVSLLVQSPAAEARYRDMEHHRLGGMGSNAVLVLVLECWTGLYPLKDIQVCMGICPISLHLLYGLGAGIWPHPLRNSVGGASGAWGISPIVMSLYICNKSLGHFTSNKSDLFPVGAGLYWGKDTELLS